METNTFRIVAAVVDTRHLTMYKESGEVISLPQGDSRIRKIIDEATPMLIQQGYADVTLVQENAYLEFESMTNGVVQLYRIAKDELKALFDLGIVVDTPVEETVAPVSIGTVPEAVKQTTAAVEEIMQHAVSVSSSHFHEENVAKQGNVIEEDGNTIKSHSEDSSSETIVAVVDGKIIPGMEKIKTQFARASKLGSTVGMENFLKRVASVIEDRSHSVEDLLKFLERADLPIADDGSILIYKVLKFKGDKTDGKYVDCHTRKVEQWTGAYVCMDMSLVDRNRNNECSNGLHVARRGYVKEFSGDVCVLAKLAPEDVIAVPLYDANKMRVCGYHIIMELSDKQYKLLNQNKPITDDPEGKVLLAQAMSGNHIHKTHEVRITQQQGLGVVVTELSSVTPTVKKVVTTKAEALGNASTEGLDEPIDPKAVMVKVEQLSRKEQAAKLYADGDIEKLKALKKLAKVSWDKLGVPDPDITPPVMKPKEVTVEDLNSDEVLQLAPEGSYKYRIHKLLSIGLNSVGVAQAIRDLKKKSKKSWEYLEVSAEQAERVTTLAQ